VLLVAAWQALAGADETDIPLAVQKLALAVECFHKASLVHDDIEDDDDLRYGHRTLHAAHGVPVALNVGDLLIGEGYRLIGECAALEIPSDAVSRMLAIAAEGHRTLCLGQGDELDWVRRPGRMSMEQVLDIVRRKTAPPFEVALRLGSLAADARCHDDKSLADILRSFSQAVGIAYQVRDDLHDLCTDDGDGDLAARRPSVLLALACDAARNAPAIAETLRAVWRPEPLDADTLVALRRALRQLDVETRARRLLDGYKQQALAAVGQLRAPALKALLRRLVGKIFYDVETMTCRCSQEKQARE
jgi:geranylgeranyl pyrophosphate synthase